MKRQILLFLFSVIAAFILVLLDASSGIAAGQSAPDAVQDTPQPILTYFEDISEWRMAAGFIYLSDTCTDGSSQTTAYIRRRPTNGSILALLENISSKPQCRTFRHAAADQSGYYYYNRNLDRLEAIYSDNPTAAPTVLATIGDWDEIGSGDGISTLRLDGGNVYWIEMIHNGGEPGDPPHDLAIKRVSKSGGKPVTLYEYGSYGASLEGLGVTNTHIWWTDQNGLNRIKSCRLVACLPGQQEKIVQFPSTGTMEGHIQVSGSNVFWWNSKADPEPIRRTRCSIVGSNCTTSTAHTPASGTTIIGLTANSSSMFWTEHVGLIGRRLRRSALSGGTAEILANNVHYAAPYLNANGVYFQTGIRTISVLPIYASAFTHEIGINGWEVTQGIQRLANDVPLVAGKTTYVRLYPTLLDGDDVGAGTAELHGSSGGTPLPGSPIFPISSTVSISDTLNLGDRLSADGGWLFELPDSWTRSGSELIPQNNSSISLRGVIDPYGAYSDSDDSDNNEISGDFLFTAKAPTCINLRPVATKDYYEPATGINIGQVTELTDSVLPTPRVITYPKNDPLREIDWCWKGPVYGPFCSTPYELKDDDSGLLTKMGWLDFWADSPSICFSNNASTLYGGIIHKDAEWDWGGLARTGKDQFLTKVPKYGEPINRGNWLAMTMVHEIGHNYNRRHLQCPLPTPDPDDKDGSPLNPDLNYPYPTDKLDFNLPLSDPDLHFGFDPLYRTPVNPTTTADFMSYCGPEWYSDYTWKAIYNKTRDPIFVPTLVPDSALAGELARISGLIDDENNRGTLDYAWMLDAAAASAGLKERWSAALTPAWNRNSANAVYHVQLLGTNDQILADHTIELSDTEDGEEHGPQPFDLAFAAPASVVARLQLMAGDTVLASNRPGTVRPVIALSQPAGGANITGELTVSWTASDPDGDTLLYTIQYSPDNGGTWAPLLVNYGGTGAAVEKITLDLSSEAGSNGKKARVRVLASDGYNTAVATSQPFSVAKRAPSVAITIPAVGQTYAAGEIVALHGGASDPEDGLIADNKFSWSTGQTGQTANLNGLAPGDHSVALTATDSDGQKGDGSVDFSVAPLFVALTDTAPTLDGRCDDAAYNGAAQLQLSPYAAGPPASARLIHGSGQLWLCIAGLQNAGGYAGLLVDAGNSGGTAVSSSDFGYFVKQDGTPFVNMGNGSGFVSAPAGALSARIVDNGTVWSAELQINRSALGTWQQRSALAVGHFKQSGNKTSIWPHSAGMTTPKSWAQTNFGLAAALTAVTPDTAVLGTGDIPLTISGSNFAADNVVFWNGAKLTSTLLDAKTLSVVVPVNLAAAAGIYDVSVGVEGQPDLTTAPYSFTVYNPQPAINALSPDTAEMGSGATAVTINGARFINGATVIWDGEKQATIFLSPTKLRINLTIADLSSARAVPLVVRNPDPAAAASNSADFIISSGMDGIFLPLIRAKGS